MSVDIDPGDPHNDQTVSRARDDLDQHVASARDTLTQADGSATAATVVVAVALIDHPADFPRDRLAAMLAVALVRLAAEEQT